MGNDEQMSSGLESLGAPKRKKKKKDIPDQILCGFSLEVNACALVPLVIK